MINLILFQEKKLDRSDTNHISSVPLDPKGPPLALCRP